MKIIINKIILLIFILILLFSALHIVNAETEQLDIKIPEVVTVGENFDVSLIVPEETYGMQADVKIVYSDGSIEEKKHVYIKEFSGKQTVIFYAKVIGKTTITFSNILLSDEKGNKIDAEKSKSLEFEIQKKNIPMTGLSLNLKKATINFNKENKLQLIASKNPGNATNEEKIVWNSSDTAVAIVSDNGLVTALSQGITNITASCNGYTATCDVLVEKRLTKIKIDNPITSEYIENSYNPSNVTEISSYTWELGKYGFMSFALQAFPADVTNVEEVEWTSSDESIIRLEKPQINNSSGSTSASNYKIPGYGKAKAISHINVYTVSPGTATITAKCGDLIDTYTITVVAPIKEFKLDKTKTWIYLDGNLSNTRKIETIINPENTTDSTIVSWSTSDSSVVTVNNGVLTPTGLGTATVVARCGSFTASCKVTVQNEVIKGDITGDGEIKIFDSFQILKDVLVPGTTLSEIDKQIRDFNGDGQVRIYDAFQFLKQAILN